MGKICYTYNKRKENIYSGTYDAQESPREPGVYYLPADATWLEPLPYKENYLVCFNTNTNEWEYLLDLSKITYYDTRTSLLVEFPIREEVSYYTELKPEYPDMHWNGKKWTIKLSKLKEDILRDIDFYRKELEKEGFPLREHGIIDMNEKTYKALNDVVQDAFNRLEDTITFRLKDNTFKVIPKEEAFLSSLDMWRKLEENNKVIWNIKDSVREAKSFKEITTIPFKETTLLEYMSRYKNVDVEEVTDANS